MTGGKRNRLGVEKIYPTCNIGLGTTGGETAALARQRSVERLLDLKGLSGVERIYVGQLLQQVFPLLIFDSGIAKSRDMQPAFAGDEPERVEFPTSYLRLPSPGGQELITQKESPPYLHMKDFIEDHLDLLQQKTANAEAQSCPLFGAANAFSDIVRIDQQVRTMVTNMHNLSNSPAWGELTELGFPLTDETTLINVCGSGAGGQAIGLFVLILVLLNQRLLGARSRYKIAIDFLSPGFTKLPKEAVAKDQQIKSLSVLADLMSLKAGNGIEIRHPRGNLKLEGSAARDIFDECYFHPPRATSGDAFASFISAVASLIVDRALSPYADDWRMRVANDPYLAAVPEFV
jgi:hypothetical protein